MLVVPPFLSHSTILKTNTDRLSLQSDLSAKLVKSFAREDLQGVLFYISRSGMEYPHMYCYEYDKYICETFGR